jgi:hypothetical protein
MSSILEVDHLNTSISEETSVVNATSSNCCRGDETTTSSHSSAAVFHCEECAICLDRLCQDAPSTICNLPCGHQFHSSCVDGIRSSTAIRVVCPLCRADIPKDAKTFFREGNVCYNSLAIQDNTEESDLSFLELSTLQLAIVNWVEAAGMGHAGAMYNIALLCRRGLGVDQSDSEAFEWVSKAARSGSASAQANLGYYYNHGIATSVDVPEAVKWYTLAAEQENAYGLYNLGVMYQYGRGVPQDNETAIALYFEAHCNNCQPAAEALLRQRRAHWTQIPFGECVDVDAVQPYEHSFRIQEK